VLVLLQLPGLVGYARRRFAAGRAGRVAIEEARTPA
jgi:hypothetical protein